MEKIKVVVGSLNQVKISAVQEAFDCYKQFSRAEILGKEVHSGVAEQPLSLEETIQGAKNRAHTSFFSCDYSVGLESGMFRLPESSLYAELTACALYDGKNISLGFSPAFVCPPEITRLILKEKLDLNSAAFSAGYTKNKKLGSAEGIVGVLTQGVLDRFEYTTAAVIMAIIPLLRNR